MGNRNLVKEIVNDILRVNGSAETVGIIDTNLAIDHAIALSSRFRVLYWLANVGAFPVLQDQISGDGFKEITKVEDIGHVLENSDFILITDCYFGRLADYLRSQGVPVFGAPYEWTRIENDRVYGWKRLREMDVGVPNGVILRGIDAVRKYIKENEREGRVFYLKVSKYRGNKETGCGVLNEVEALTSLSQAGFGPYLDDLEILVQEKCPGEEIGFDCFVNGKDFIRPFLYTIEIKGEGTLGVWTEKNGIEDHIFKKIKQSLVDTDYRGNISMEFFWDGSRVYVHDPTSRLPFPCSAIQAHFIKNYPDVLQKVANGQDVRCIVGSEKYVAQVGVYTDDNESWRVIRFPEELRDRIGFRRVVKRNGDYYYVPGDYLVATALGDGKTPEKAVRSALDVASQIECSNTYIPARFEMDVLEVVRKLNKLGGGFEF